MLGNARHLQQLSSMGIKARSINSRLIKLIIILLPLTLFSSRAIAFEPLSNNSTVAQKAASSDNRHRLPSSNSRLYVEPVISPGRVRLMRREVEGLIDRFEATLLTAEAGNSDITASTGEVIQQIINKQTITSKQNLKRIKSQHRDAHRALYRAKQGLKRFESLIDQRYYSLARAQWSAARQVLWDNYPSDRIVAQSEVRAMWLDRGTIVKARSKADLVPIFDRMATAGINTVFFETVNSGYTIYPSQVAPQQNPLVKGWNPLEAAIQLAHERGMELHAWVWTFAAVNQRHNVILGLPRN